MGDRRLVATVVAIAALTAAPRAHAQPEPEEPEVEMPATDEPPPDGAAPAPAPPAEPDPAAKAEAKKLLAGGDAFFKKAEYLRKRKKANEARAQYERALQAYTKAYERVPNPKILYPIAVAEAALERWVDAATHYRDFLKGATDADAKQRAEAEKKLEAVKMSIGVLALTVTPDGAQVAIDGTPVGTTPLADPLFLAPGEYTLAITAENFKPLEQKLAIEAGSESERTFELDSAAVIIEAPRPPPMPKELPPVPPAPSKTVLYVSGGVTVALLAGAVTTGIMAVGKNGTFKDEDNSPGTREDARTSGKNLALLTDGLIVGTAVAAGFTAYYYLKVYKPKRADHARRVKERNDQLEEFARHDGAPPKVIVTPWVQADAGGLAITGSLW